MKLLTRDGVGRASTETSLCGNETVLAALPAYASVAMVEGALFEEPDAIPMVPTMPIPTPGAVVRQIEQTVGSRLPRTLDHQFGSLPRDEQQFIQPYRRG
jgi:hypothetical protein